MDEEDNIITTEKTKDETSWLDMLLSPSSLLGLGSLGVDLLSQFFINSDKEERLAKAKSTLIDSKIDKSEEAIIINDIRRSGNTMVANTANQLAFGGRGSQGNFIAAGVAPILAQTNQSIANTRLDITKQNSLIDRQIAELETMGHTTDLGEAFATGTSGYQTGLAVEKKGTALTDILAIAKEVKKLFSGS